MHGRGRWIRLFRLIELAGLSMLLRSAGVGRRFFFALRDLRFLFCLARFAFRFSRGPALRARII